MRLPRGSIAGVAVGLGIAVIAGAAYMVGLSSGAKNAAESVAPIGAQEVTPPGPMYVWKERVVNLADQGARRYLKVGMSIEFSTHAEEFRKASPEERAQKLAEFEKSIAPNAPVIDDAIISLLSGRTSAEVGTPEGKVRLKNDIKETLNRLLGGDQVTNIYFTQFVTQ